MNLNDLKEKDVSIGGRTGHYFCLRSFLIKKLSAEQVALMSDSQCVEKMLDLGFVPVEVKGQRDDNETVYLVQRSVLEDCIKLVR